MDNNYMHTCYHAFHCDNCHKDWCSCQIGIESDKDDDSITHYCCPECGKRISWSKFTTSTTEV